MSYKESKRILDKIRDDYGCKGEILFKEALRIVIECGQCTVLSNAWYVTERNDINERHDLAQKTGKLLFIGRNFELQVLECAREIAEVPVMDLLQYVQKEVWLSGEDMFYQRAIGLLKSCMEWLNEDISGVGDTLEAFYHIGFHDYEIEELGYGWLFEEEEE